MLSIELFWRAAESLSRLHVQLNTQDEDLVDGGVDAFFPELESFAPK